MPSKSKNSVSGFEQLNLPEVGDADRRLPLKAWGKLVDSLESRSHGSRERALAGSPRVYWLHGTYRQLIRSPHAIPRCLEFTAYRVDFGSRTDPIFGELVASWSLCGRQLPASGNPFFALCTQTKRCIGWGRVAFFEGQVMALLNKGRAGDFLPYTKDAYGLILVFCWSRRRV
ncbi:MAG: hypothetical protein ACSHX8_07320 [Opitutaceae bacterium]